MWKFILRLFIKVNTGTQITGNNNVVTDIDGDKIEERITNSFDKISKVIVAEVKKERNKRKKADAEIRKEITEYKIKTDKEITQLKEIISFYNFDKKSK